MSLNKASRRLCKMICAILVVCIIVFPIYWMIITSLKSSAELLSNELSLFPKEPTIQNYISAIRNEDIKNYFLNTVVSTLGILLGQVITGTLAAYGLANTKSKMKNVFFVIIMGAMMIPIQVTFIPLYILFAKLNLVNTFPGIILPEIVSPFLIYMLKNSFENTNKDLIDTGKMDGLSKLKLLLYVYIPENKSKFIATVFVLFINSWNSYFWPKVITNNKTRRVLAVGIAYLKTTYGGDVIGNYNEIMAVSILTIIPVIVLFLILQKHITNNRLAE